MFLGLTVLVIVVSISAILAIKAVKGLFRWLTGERKERNRAGKSEEANAKKKPEKTETEEKNPEEEETPAEEISEETRQRYAAALYNGISESFSREEDSSFRINENELSALCTGYGELSVLEFSSRALAGDSFMGFNLVIEDNERMVLTYGGEAVASITRFDRETTAVINGETVTGTEPAFRVNTFPPELRDGMAVSDVVRMMDAAEHIKTLGGNILQVSEAMVDYFMDGDNVAKLKPTLVKQIRQREARSKKRDLHERKEAWKKSHHSPRV